MQNKINKPAKNANAKNAMQLQPLKPNAKGEIYRPQIYANLQRDFKNKKIGERELLMGKKAIRAKIRRQLDWAIGQWEENGETLPPETLQKFLTWAYQIFLTPTQLFSNNKTNINKFNKFQTYINQNLQKN